MQAAQQISNDQPHLPVDTAQALRSLIVLSERLLDFSERETQALIQNDMATFAILQDEKQAGANRYNAACQEFSERIEDFRGCDTTLLNRLETLQISLSEKMRSNCTIVNKINDNANAKIKKSIGVVDDYKVRFTANTLLNAQESTSKG